MKDIWTRGTKVWADSRRFEPRAPASSRTQDAAIQSGIANSITSKTSELSPFLPATSYIMAHATRAENRSCF